MQGIVITVKSDSPCFQVLEVLWELAHLPTLPTSLVQQALEEHLGIFSDAYAVKETVKRSYIIKCIEDIKKVRQVYYRCSVLPPYMRAVYCSVIKKTGLQKTKALPPLFWLLL